MKLIFLHEDKQTILQVHINFDGHGQACPNTKDNKFAKSLQYVKKKVKDEVDLLRRWTSKVFYKLILSFVKVIANHA